MMFENMPLLNYEDDQYGWKQVYLGLLSPYRNKFQKYLEVALLKAQQEKFMSSMQENKLKVEDGKIKKELEKTINSARLVPFQDEANKVKNRRRLSSIRIKKVNPDQGLIPIN